MRDPAVKRWSSLHTVLYRASGGRVGRRLVDNDILLLTTVGRHTGRPHTVPLLFLRDGARLLVIASYGGRPGHPDWYRNLQVHPTVEVQVEDAVMSMRARTAIPEERAAWWRRVVDAYDGYSAYQSRTARVIPLVFLEPLEESSDQPG